MIIKSARVKNYRLLKDVVLTIDKTTTLIVGRNNTGKTSLAEVFRSFLSTSGPRICYEDFNQSCLTDFETALTAYKKENVEKDVRLLVPTIELELLLDYTSDKDDYGVLGDFIIDLDDELFETRVLVSYQLKGGKIKDFFQSLDVADRRKYFSDLKILINQHFEAVVYAIEPTNPENRVRLELPKFRRLFLSGLINAQRGLDDETHNERDVLGKSLGKIFNSANSSGAPETFKAKSEEVNKVVEELQLKVDTDFQEKVKALLPTLSIFGYPGLQDPNLSAATELNVKSLLESNTRVFYQGEDYFALPETYNGLGVRNLIFILFRIYEYFREFQSQNTPPKGHLVFIEEPEAHLHPQMQEVFIRQLGKIVGEFEKQLNDGNVWPVQFVVSTHSSHIANEADFSKVRYFLTKQGNETKVKDLGEAFKEKKAQEDKEFLHKYLTLTKCDLYFADRAILIEGATERIILPEMIRKVDALKKTGLRRKYLSVVEIGGAYAHHFYKFIDFLELRTLVVTDLDSVKKTVKVNEGGKKTTSYPASFVSEGTHSSNSGLSKWYGIDGYAELSEICSNDPMEADNINSLSENEISILFEMFDLGYPMSYLFPKNSAKTSGCRRIAHQVPEKGEGICGRSFEDAFILANKNLFELNDLGGVELENAVFKKAQGIGNSSKANFAIEYSVDKTDWAVPKYICEGLEWLDDDQENATEEAEV